MIYEVFLMGGQSVYLKDDPASDYPVIFLTIEGFWKIWLPSQRDERKPDNWFLPKYRNVARCFSQSKTTPVWVPRVGKPIKINNVWTLTMRDGATRIQWLYDHGATTFPAEVCPERIDILAAIAGAKSK